MLFMRILYTIHIRTISQSKRAEVLAHSDQWTNNWSIAAINLKCTRQAREPIFWHDEPGECVAAGNCVYNICSNRSVKNSRSTLYLPWVQLIRDRLNKWPIVLYREREPLIKTNYLPTCKRASMSMSKFLWTGSLAPGRSCPRKSKHASASELRQTYENGVMAILNLLHNRNVSNYQSFYKVFSIQYKINFYSTMRVCVHTVLGKSYLRVRILWKRPSVYTNTSML